MQQKDYLEHRTLHKAMPGRETLVSDIMAGSCF